MEFLDAIEQYPKLANNFYKELAIEYDSVMVTLGNQIEATIQARFDAEQNSDDGNNWAETQKGSPIYVDTGQLRGSLRLIKAGKKWRIFAEGVQPHKGSAFADGVALAEYLDSQRTFTDFPDDWFDTYDNLVSTAYTDLADKYIPRMQ